MATRNYLSGSEIPNSEYSKGQIGLESCNTQQVSKNFGFAKD